MEAVLIILLAVSIIICGCLSAKILTDRKRIIKLTQNIDDFLKSGKLCENSFSDSSFSHLETAISNLQNSVIHEKEFTSRQSEKNVHFISDISHQLKTPLAGLRLYTEMDINFDEKAHNKKQLELIEKMEKLIENILRLEKIKSDTYQMNFEEHRLSDIFNELKKEFMLIFPDKSINIKGSADLRCDRNWLAEAFGNIIKNACEHTNAKGIINILIEQTDKSVSVIIEDNGEGVADAQLNKLFERFHRTENAAPSSSGLGLAVTKAVVEKHHGTVSAENSQTGLKIIMCFPLTDINIKI